MKLFSRLQTAAVALAVISFCAPPAAAQRDQVRDLLKDLIESQLNNRRSDRGNNLAPTNRVPAGTSAEHTRKLGRLRPLATRYVNSSARLVQEMSRGMRQSGGLRSLVTQAVQLNAATSALARQLNSPITPDYLSASLQKIDHDHRQLTFRMNQIRDLPAGCKRQLAELDGIRDQISALYGVAPQVDRRELIRLLDTLSFSLDALVEDVNAEVNGTQNWRQLVTNGRRVQSAARSLQYVAAENPSRERVTAEYRDFLKRWQPYENRLEALNNPYLARQIRRVSETTRLLQRELLIPIVVDHDHTAHIADLIQDQLKKMGDYLNLNIMLRLPEASAIPGAMNELRGAVERFRLVEQQLGSGDPIQAWQALQTSWNTFSAYIQPTTNRRVRAAAVEIQNNIIELRESLGIQVVYDLHTITRLAGTVDSLADQMQFQAERWMRRGNPTPSGLKQQLSKLHDRAHHLHETCLSRDTREHIQEDVDRTVALWRQLQPMLAQCHSAESVALRRLSRDMTVNLIKLETLVDQ